MGRAKRKQQSAGNKIAKGESGNRMVALKWAVCLAMLSAIAMCPQLWLTDRAFPTAPALDILPVLPQVASVGIASLLVLSIFAIAFMPKPGAMSLAPPVFLGALVLFDINRLQPCLYEYGLMFVALAMVKWGDSNAKGSKAGLASCCVIVVAFYIWGGVQKFNGVFENEVFPFLVGPFGHRFTDQFKALWLVGPVGEVLIGLLLFVPRTRVLGLIGVVAMHGLLLYVLGPFGQNCDSMVWPWNIWAVIFGLILFAGNDQWIVAPALNSVAGCFILLLAGVLPILSFFGRWDVFVSMAYYSGRLRDAWITITPNGVKHLPAAYRTGNPGLTADGPGRFRLDITKWSYSATNVPPYAEPRAYVSMVKRLEAMGVPAKEMTLMVRDANGLTNNERTYSAVSFR